MLSNAKEQNRIGNEKLHTYNVTVKRTKHSVEHKCIQILMMWSICFAITINNKVILIIGRIKGMWIIHMCLLSINQNLGNTFIQGTIFILHMMMYCLRRIIDICMQDLHASISNKMFLCYQKDNVYFFHF